MKGKKLTENHTNKICEIYEAGLNPTEISNQLNFEYKTVTS